jgi:hypothetical protein
MKNVELLDDDDVTTDFVVLPLCWVSDDCWRTIVVETFEVLDPRVFADVSNELLVTRTVEYSDDFMFSDDWELLIILQMLSISVVLIHRSSNILPGHWLHGRENWSARRISMIVQMRYHKHFLILNTHWSFESLVGSVLLVVFQDDSVELSCEERTTDVIWVVEL